LRLKQDDYKFKTSLGYIVRPCLKKNKPFSFLRLGKIFFHWQLNTEIGGCFGAGAEEERYFSQKLPLTSHGIYLNSTY
jgi:hypothetical protein